MAEWRSNLPPTVYSGESLVTTAQNFSIWRAIRELSNDPTVGWKFMSQVETDQYHPTLLAALHARTYRESSLLRLSGMISVWVGKLLVSLSDVGSRVGGQILGTIV